VTETGDGAAHLLATERAEDVARRVHGSPAPAPAGPSYVGLVTRAIAFVADAAIINVVAAIVAAAVALVLSVFPVGHDLKTVVVAIGGVAFFAWVVGYFATFWTTTGQTPGNRLMQIRVTRPGGEPLEARRALLRVVGLLLAAIPLFAGFVPILLTDRRRGLADWMADSVVTSSTTSGDLYPPLAEAPRTAPRRAFELRPRPAESPGRR
jgi:uncharacterized RDD family membrane protein YckC